MPVPIIKIFVSLARTLAWPIVSVAKAKLLFMHQSYPRVDNFFYLMGLRCFKFEVLIEKAIIKNEAALYQWNNERITYIMRCLEEMDV